MLPLVQIKYKINLHKGLKEDTIEEVKLKYLLFISQIHIFDNKLLSVCWCLITFSS